MIRVQGVRVILLMAIVTRGRKRRVLIINMAVGARNDRMHTDQGKFRRGMIERRRFPCCRRVACPANVTVVGGLVVRTRRRHELRFMARVA